MATSGSIDGNHVNFTNPSNGAYTHIDWQLASQNVGGNYSTINWQFYMIFYGGAYSQIQNGIVNTNIGTVYSNGGIISGRASGNFGIGSGSFNVGHDGAGNGTLQMNMSCDIYASPSSAGNTTTWSLPTIPRYAVIDGFNINQTTDELIEFAWHADRNCDIISWWSGAYDGGGHHDIAAGGQGWWTIDLHNLISGKTFDITTAVRSAASGLWTTSGTLYATTLTQNNFARGRVL
jgi:hypothetical protein